MKHMQNVYIYIYIYTHTTIYEKHTIYKQIINKLLKHATRIFYIQTDTQHTYKHTTTYTSTMQHTYKPIHTYITAKNIFTTHIKPRQQYTTHI